jgi:uncharacterized Zn finger protein
MDDFSSRTKTDPTFKCGSCGLEHTDLTEVLRHYPANIRGMLYLCARCGQLHQITEEGVKAIEIVPDDACEHIRDAIIEHQTRIRAERAKLN